MYDHTQEFKTADIQFSPGGVVRETARAAERVAIDYHQECTRGMQTCRGVETNAQTIKLTNHTSTEMRPLLF